MIFDCCYAGNLVYHHLDRQRGYWPTRSFEFLAACKQDKLTHPPGPKSFTRALIWALEGLLEDRGKFTTHELQTEIGKAPGFPKDQHVQVLDRGDPCDQRLVLAPIPPHSSNVKSNGTNSDPPVHQPKEFFDLRFWYLSSPNEEEVTDVAKILKKLIHEEKIHANRIAWIRFGDVNRLRNIVNKWRRLPAKRSMTLEIPRNYEQGYLQSPHTPPASHSGNSSISDNHTEKYDSFRNQSSPLMPQVLPLNREMLQLDKSNLLTETIMKIDFSSYPVSITRDAKRVIPHHTQWLHPNILLFLMGLLWVLLSLSAST